MRLAILIWLGFASASAVFAEAPAETDPAAIIQDYCLAIADAAADARIAHQERQLKALEEEVEKKLTALDARRVELETWVEKYEAMLKTANAGLVGIYAKMDPETAARQLAEVSRTTAVSIIAQLTARNASAILNEMPPEAAAELVKALAAPLAGKSTTESKGKENGS